MRLSKRHPLGIAVDRSLALDATWVGRSEGGIAADGNAERENAGDCGKRCARSGGGIDVVEYACPLGHGCGQARQPPCLTRERNCDHHHRTNENTGTRTANGNRTLGPEKK